MPAKVVLRMNFHDEVAVDMFYLDDKDKLKHTIMLVMDTTPAPEHQESVRPRFPEGAGLLCFRMARCL